MATDDGAPRMDAGDLTPERAIKTIAALHDAISAARVPKNGEKADADTAERLAWLLIQGYNQLLARGVKADARHGTRIRFDVIAALDAHETAIAEVGIRRTGEGGLTLWAGELTTALAERPVSTIRFLRNAGGACACLTAYVCRALAGLGGAGSAQAGEPGQPVSIPAPAAVSESRSAPSAARVWVPEARPRIQVSTFQPSPYGVNESDPPPVQGDERPEFYA